MLAINVLLEHRDYIVAAVATSYHQLWRDEWRAVHGNDYRIKITVDKDWIDRNKTNQVNIAALSYDELPEDWQCENKANAEVAVDLVIGLFERKSLPDKVFIEEAAAVVHSKWLERNHKYAPEDQRLEYVDLSEKNKEKDRLSVRKAIEACFFVCFTNATSGFVDGGCI